MISEQCIKTHKDGLQGLYSDLLDFIPAHCKSLKDITAGTGRG